MMNPSRRGSGWGLAGGTFLVAAALMGCPPPNDIMETAVNDAADTSTADTADTSPPDVGMDAPALDTSLVDAGDVGTTDAADSAVPCPASPTPVDVRGNIATNTTWTCANVYILRDNAPTFITNNAVLTIGPGTIVRGGASRSALIATRGSRIEAAGSRDQPIVFTSNQPVGMRRSGDWGGVAMLGRASINEGRAMPAEPGVNVLEGLMPGAEEMNGAYGGGSMADDNYNCGTMRYVRIEFAGNELTPNNELNGLTLCGCGRQTTIDFVQVHRGADDAVEIFGGTMNVRHVLATLFEDDGLDWDQGWRGRGQFIIAQGIRVSTEADPSGIEADNDRNVNTAMPASEPLLYNLTIVGSGSDNMVTYQNRGVVLRRGTAGRIFNMILQGWPTGGVDVRDTATFTLAMGSPARLGIANSILFSNGMGGSNHFFESPTDTFDEGAWYMAGASNRVDVNPMLSAPTNETAPNFTPPTGGAASMLGATPPASEGFDPAATYLGAIEPGSTSNWTSGWAAFPAN